MQTHQSGYNNPLKLGVVVSSSAFTVIKGHFTLSDSNVNGVTRVER